MNERDNIITALYQVIRDRKSADPATSYTASLLHKGNDKILKKIGEEAAEVIIAGKGGERGEIIYESADLIYHLLVLLGFHDIDPGEVMAELARRFGVSGHAEKAARAEKT